MRGSQGKIWTLCTWKAFDPDNKHPLTGHNCLMWSFHITGFSEAPSLVFLALISCHVSMLEIYLRALHSARWPTAQGSVISKGLCICPNPHMLTTLPLPTLLTSQRMDPFGWKPFDQCLISLIIQFSSVIQSCPTLCDPMNRSTPGLPVHHQLPEST